MDLKDGLGRMHSALSEVEEAARKLQNQNFADIVQMAKRRVEQLVEHPDVDLVHKELEGEHPRGEQSSNSFDKKD